MTDYDAPRTLDGLARRVRDGRLSRREFVRRATALGLSMPLAVAALAACGATATPTAGSGGAAATGEEYKIGTNLDTSGAGSSLGVPERDTLTLYEKQVNDAGGIKGPDGKNHRIRVIIYDNTSDEAQSVQVTRRLIDDDKVVLIIGATRTATTQAIIGEVTRAQVPLISLAASAALVEPVADRKWIFKTPQSDALMIASILKTSQGRGYKRVAFLSAGDAFGSTARDVWLKLVPEAGITTTVDDRFGVADKDLTTQLNRVKSSDAEALVLWGITDATAVGVKNYADLGMKIPLFLSHGVANRAFLDLAGPAANGALLPAGKLLTAESLPDSDAQKPVLLKYAREYEAAYGAGKRNTFGGHAWDALQIALQVLGKVGPDRAKIRDEIENVKGFVGITGIFNFSAQDHNGLDERAVQLTTIEGGNWKAVTG